MRPGLGLAVIVVVAVAVALAIHGYAFELGTENQPLQIPAIEHRVDPTLFPGDLLVQSLESYPSIFFPLAALVRRTQPLEVPFFVAHLVTLAGAAAGIAAIAQLLGAGRGGMLIAALLLLVSPLVRPAFLSRDTLVAHWVTPTTVAFPILLAALYFLLRGKSGWAGIIAGIAALLNAVTAGLFLFVALLATLAEGGRWGRILRLMAGFGLVSWPILIRLPTRSLGAPSGREFLALLADYYPYHFFPSAHSPHVYLRLALLIAAAAIAWRALPRTMATRRVLWVAVAVAILIVVGGGFAEVVPIASVTKLHLMRTDRWFYVLFLAALGVQAGGRPGEGAERWLGIGMLAIAAGALRGAFPLIAWGVILAALDRPWPARVRIPLPAAATGLGLWQLVLASYLGSALLLGGLAALAARVLFVRHPHPIRGQWVVRGAALALVLAEFLRAAPTAGPGGWTLARPAFEPAWREIQDWAARSTPPSARFLTPPAIPGFRVYARRGTVVERKDGAAMLWTPSFGPAWKERLAAVEAALAARDTTLLEAVARRYGADYAVVDRAHTPSGSTPVHANDRFQVLAMRATGADLPPPPPRSEP